MKLRGTLAAASAVALLATALSFEAPSEDDFQWLTDLDAAREEAAASGRPMLVVFR